MRDFLVFLGVVTLCVLICGVIFAVYSALKDQIDRWKYNYRIKHRFDKPPTAKCYCVDCEHHSNETQRCYGFEGQYTADSWFCWQATPKEET
jgi:hypothetical protein